MHRQKCSTLLGRAFLCLPDVVEPVLPIPIFSLQIRLYLAYLGIAGIYDYLESIFANIFYIFKYFKPKSASLIIMLIFLINYSKKWMQFYINVLFRQHWLELHMKLYVCFQVGTKFVLAESQSIN